jgi:hypothetical protein
MIRLNSPAELIHLGLGLDDDEDEASTNADMPDEIIPMDICHGNDDNDDDTMEKVD